MPIQCLSYARFSALNCGSHPALHFPATRATGSCRGPTCRMLCHVAHYGLRCVVVVHAGACESSAT